MGRLVSHFAHLELSRALCWNGYVWRFPVGVVRRVGVIVAFCVRRVGSTVWVNETLNGLSMILGRISISTCSEVDCISKGETGKTCQRPFQNWCLTARLRC